MYIYIYVYIYISIYLGQFQLGELLAMATICLLTAFCGVRNTLQPHGKPVLFAWRPSKMAMQLSEGDSATVSTDCSHLKCVDSTINKSGPCKIRWSHFWQNRDLIVTDRDFNYQQLKFNHQKWWLNHQKVGLSQLLPSGTQTYKGRVFHWRFRFSDTNGRTITRLTLWWSNVACWTFNSMIFPHCYHVYVQMSF